MAELGMFEYSALLPDHVRLLQLSQVQHEANLRIQCEISQFPIRSCPPYTALSYTWGDSSWLKSISLNNRDFRVTPNLHAFLQEALDRRRWQDLKAEWLWIDAICINQSNVSERNLAVSNMKVIFEAADKIICWLGSVDVPRLEAAAIASVDRLAELSHDPRYLKLGGLRNFYINFQEFHEIELESLRLVFKAAWWTRAWIVQEATTPKSPGHRLIWFGSHERTFEHFSLANKVLSSIACIS